MAFNGKYKDWISGEGFLKIQAWSRDGLTNEDIAHNIGIATGTFYEWLKRFPELANALKTTREVADIRVENSLYKRANGYDYVEETQELRLDKESGEYRMVTTKTITRHMPPDTTAQIFWLKNRKPNDWRDRREVQAEVTEGKETGVALMAPVLEEENAEADNKA